MALAHRINLAFSITCTTQPRHRYSALSKQQINQPGQATSYALQPRHIASSAMGANSPDRESADRSSMRELSSLSSCSVAAHSTAIESRSVRLLPVHTYQHHSSKRRRKSIRTCWSWTWTTSLMILGL